MKLKNILYEKDAETGIARITFNRPAARNALDTATRKELRDIENDLRTDPAVRLAIITGAGDEAFISGADINALKELTPFAAEEMSHYLGQGLFTQIEDLDIPVIAMINGFCLGGGMELSMCCDIRIASDNSSFGQPETKIGIIPGGGGTQRLPRLVGWGKAKEMIYTGRIIDAAEAREIGLVDRVVPRDKLEDVTMQVARSIVSKSPLIIKLAKRAINRGMYGDMARGLDYERSNFALCFATEDHNEGISAFLEKRKPVFKGR